MLIPLADIVNKRAELVEIFKLYPALLNGLLNENRKSRKILLHFRTCIGVFAHVHHLNESICQKKISIQATDKGGYKMKIQCKERLEGEPHFSQATDEPTTRNTCMPQRPYEDSAAGLEQSHPH